MAQYSSYPTQPSYSHYNNNNSNISHVAPPPPPPPPVSSSSSNYNNHAVPPPSSSSSHAQHSNYDYRNGNNKNGHYPPPPPPPQSSSSSNHHNVNEYKSNKQSSYGPTRGSNGYGYNNAPPNESSSSRNNYRNYNKNYDSYSRSRSKSRSYSPPPYRGNNNNHSYPPVQSYRNDNNNGSSQPYYNKNHSNSHSSSSSSFYRNGNNNFNNNNNGMKGKNEFGIPSGQPGSSLHRIEWSKIQLQPFQKNFYHESSTLNELKEIDIIQWRKDNDISVTGLNIPKPIRTFEEAGFPDYILTEIRRAGFNKPTAIQSQGWPMAMSGRDVIGIAETGSGKTLAFLLPCIVHINAQPLLRHGDGPITLIIAPTRELACQIDNETNKFATSSKIKHTCVYGGINRRGQIEKLRTGAEICICTPGRLLDFLENNVTNLKRVTYLVIDEADRLLDMGFEPQLKAIMSQVRPDRQILMWSATWPLEVRSLASEFMNKDTIQVAIGSLEISANHSVTQIIEVVQTYEKINKLFNIIKQHQHQYQSSTNHEIINQWKILVFTSTKRMCDDVTKILKQDGWPVTSIHGDKEQYERDSALESFKSGKTQIMLATDVASRGIHVDNITLVINYDFPGNIEDYVHRIGRTARCGKKGIAVSFVTKDDAKRIPKLIAVLTEAKQNIPSSLTALAATVSNSSSNYYSRYNNNSNSNVNNNNNNNNNNNRNHVQQYRPPNNIPSSSNTSQSTISNNNNIPTHSQQAPMLNYNLEHYHPNSNNPNYMMNNHSNVMPSTSYPMTQPVQV